MKKFGPRLLLLGFGLGAALFAAHEFINDRRRGGWGSERGEAPVIENFRLLDADGRFHELYRYRDAKAIVFFSHGLGCPIVTRSLSALLNIQEKFARQGVVFLMINASPQDSPDAIRRWAKKNAVEIPVLIDVTQSVAKSIGIDRTATAVLLDPKRWEIAYGGALDDRLDYDGEKNHAGQRFLEDALASLLRERRVAIDRTEAKGCLISYARATPTYTREVAPILRQKCLNCHVEGKDEPSNMWSYEEVRGWAPMIREVLRMGRMPPGRVEPALQDKFANRTGLTPKEARTLMDWIEAGAPRGEGPDPLLVSKDAGSALPRAPDILFRVPAQIIPAESRGPIYRRVPLGRPTSRDLWVSGLRLRPENLNVSHHITLLVSTTPFSFSGGVFAAGMSRDQDSDPVFSDFWNPGKRPDNMYPEGTAWFIPRGSYFALEQHYESSGRLEMDRAEIGLYLYKGVSLPKRIKRKRIINDTFSVPPRAKEHVLEKRWRTPRVIRVYRAGIHMHHRGLWGEIIAVAPGGGSEVLYKAPRYNWHWQVPASLKKPQLLSEGTEIVVRGAFDNSELNASVEYPDRPARAGAGTYDEMFKGTILYTEE